MPYLLYRGDSDPAYKRKIREFYDPNINGGYSSSGLLLTNLNNSGIGREIFETSFQNLVQRHVCPGWNKTHFLSFSECEDRALFFGSGGKKYIPWFGEKNWDFFILRFSLSSMTSIYKNEIFRGVYYMEYDTQQIEFNYRAKIILINLVEYFNALIKLNIKIAPEHLLNVKRDKEWLIIPVNEFSNGEFSCKIATECIQRIDYFVFN